MAQAAEDLANRFGLNGAKANGRWNPPATARALMEMGDWFFARNGADTLYSFVNGIYTPARLPLLTFLSRWMGDDWRQSRADELVRYFKDQAPELWARPPLGRINLANGILNVETGELEPHTPDFLTTVQIPITFDPAAECPRIMEFIQAVFPEDVQPLAYELAGWLLFADPSWQQAVMLVGPGGNGKSSYLGLLIALLGKHNCSHITLQDIADNRFAAAGLYGKLANIVGDISQQALRSTSRFKGIVAGDPMTAEVKFGQPFDFAPYARLLFSANEPPGSPDATYAFLRRWLVIPFTRTFTGANRDKHILDHLTMPEELSGFFNLALSAYQEVRERDAFTSGASLEETSVEFRESVDAVIAFLEEVTEPDMNSKAEKSALYGRYKEWCKEGGRKGVLGKKRFNNRVRAAPNVGETVSRGKDFWTGFYVPQNGQLM